MTSNQFMADNNADSMTLHSNDVKLSDKSLQENLLVSGVMPSGRITLRFELVRDGSNTPVDVPKIVILDIISIRILKPISPGIAASRMQDFTPSIFTPYPQFIWASDLMPVVYPQEIIKFTVSVYDNPGQRNVPAEILRSAPLWSIDINGGREINYAQYPMTSAPQLKPDHVYYWQVVAHLLGPENRELAGELFSFTIADLDFGINLTPTQNDILNCLQIILGPNYGYILQDLKEMTPDESINLNGQTINITTLKAIAERFARNELIVRDVSLENK